MASSAPSSSSSSSNPGPDSNPTNLRPTTYDTWCGVAHGCTRKLGLKICGFLQRTNSLEEKSRIVSAFKERQSSKNLISCENSEREARFRRTETDFSNLFARDTYGNQNLRTARDLI
ncbi:glutamate decarboxylase 1 isoform 3-T6 [Sarcophilus harrisii]